MSDPMKSHEVAILHRSWAMTNGQPLDRQRTRDVLVELESCLREREHLVELLDELRTGPWAQARQLLGDQETTGPWPDVRRLLGQLYQTLQRPSEPR